MNDALSLLGPPLLVAITLVGIHAYFGIQVLARGVIFVDLALAQIAALGATAAFMLGHAPQSLAAYGYSLAFTMLAAALLTLTRIWATRIPQEALIGVIYVVAAAAAILLIDRRSAAALKSASSEMRKTFGVLSSMLFMIGGIAHAASPDAWAAHYKEVASSCIEASGLRNARPAGAPVDFDDEVGYTAMLIQGRYPHLI